MTWEEFKIKYPEYREDMTVKREQEFINDCFSCYENEGFSKNFGVRLKITRVGKVRVLTLLDDAQQKIKVYVLFLCGILNLKMELLSVLIQKKLSLGK